MKKCQKSYILVSVLIIMTVMIAITYFLSDSLFSELAISRNQKAAAISFHLAEAGVQEAVWRIQNDPTTRDTFLHTINGQTNFAHNPALISGGSYEVTITNIAEAAATVSATGHYKIGLKSAQRKILVNVTKAAAPPPYNYDGVILTGGSTGEEDITLDVINLNVTNGGSLISSRDIWYTLSNINVAKDILAKRNIRNVFSNVTAGGVIL